MVDSDRHDAELIMAAKSFVALDPGVGFNRVLTKESMTLTDFHSNGAP